MTKELTIVSTVKPKPTRGEILDAMTQLECERRNDSLRADVAKKEALGKELEKQILDLFLSDTGQSAGNVNLGHWYKSMAKVSGVEIRFEITRINPDFNKRLKEYHALPDRYYDADFQRVRKELLTASRGFDANDKGKRLLSDEASKKALESALDALTK